MAYEEIIYLNILGFSLVMWIGIISLILLIIASLIGALVPKGIIKIGLGWHMRIAKIAVFLAIIHAVLALIGRM